ncbi:unnamed protein product [Bursaphelenchus okinawaensis]|uniref:HTH psq-type domain-containing protein n=1 Tax=Bursaphelenchus okinawaensis TaxID=465554 RepID=A0A811JSD3_9BILA|nr:unnamed protein product [Bursaphelenchus okinawaensis]CAG9080702.1 unnamed protein product [Bursaphelenchus okinawaensis]
MSLDGDNKDDIPAYLATLIKASKDQPVFEYSDKYLIENANNNGVSENSVKKRKCYSVSIKLEAIQYAKKHTTFMAAEKYGVDRKCIRDWMIKEKELEKCTGDQKRIKGAGRPPRPTKNSAEEEEKEETYDDNVFVTLLSQIQKKVQNEDSEPLQPLPSTTSTKKKGEAPPLLERMDDDDETVDNEPPPLIAANSNSSYSLRPKRTVVVPATVAPPLKKARVSLAPIPSTSNGSDADLIKQLRTQLTEKNTEIHLLKKKLLATEELLAFYMNTTTPEINESESLVAKSEANDKPQQNQALKIGNQRISWKAARPQSPQATAMVVECSQDSLQQHLSGLNRADSTDLDSNSNEVTSKTVTTEGSKWHDLRSKRTVNITLDDTESRPGVNVFMYLDYADEFQIRFDANINQCKFKINLTRRDGGSKRLIFGFNANKEPKNETILQERFFIVHFHWSPKRIQFLSGGAIAIGHEIKGSCASSDEKRQNRTLYHGRIRTNNINRMYLDVTYLPDETVLNEVKQKDTDITIEIQEMLDANKLLAIIL